jgi:hypothetical protein
MRKKFAELTEEQKQRIRDANKRWRIRNPEKIQARNKAWNDAHREEKNRKRREFGRTPEGRELNKLYQRAWRKANRAKCKVYEERRRAKKRELGGNRARLRDAIERYLKGASNG